MNREKALTVLESHKAHWKRLLEEKICDETEGKETIKSFDMAISSLSAEGEYIKKEDAYNCFLKWRPYMATRMDKYEKEMSELPTYSFPNSAENKGDLISRQAVKNIILGGVSTDTDVDKEYVCGLIDNLPSVENKGEWIRHKSKLANTDDSRECSNCHVYLNWDMPRNSFCPNCGADMRRGGSNV